MKNSKRLLIILKNPVSSIGYFVYSICYKGYGNIKAQIIRSRYDIHPSVRFWADTSIYGDGKIIIDEGTYFGHNTFVVSNPSGATIRIGKRCAISHNVQIRTSDNNTGHLKDDVRKKNIGDITIGDNVWIGAGVFIRSGITIGSNVALGANSVITKDVPPNTVVGGVPGRIIKNIDDHEE